MITDIKSASKKSGVKSLQKFYHPACEFTLLDVYAENVGFNFQEMELMIKSREIMTHYPFLLKSTGVGTLVWHART